VRKIDLLRELQELDSALDRARERLEQGRAMLGDESELVALRQRLESARRELRALQTKGRDLELRLEKEITKRKADEKKLYDGSIKNPKELTGLARDVELQRERVSHLEDEVLMNMDAVESAAAVVDGAEKALAERERAWMAEQEALKAECDSLETEVESLGVSRSRVAALLDAATLRGYDSLRRARGGLAVVAVEQRACQGCRISLSSAEVQRARSSPEPITCQSCGRFLYVP